MRVKIYDRWNEYLKRFPGQRKDVYYTEEYTKLYEGNGDTALCIVCEEDEKILLMPFLRRRIKDYFDFETAYGYGGPITNTDDSEWTDRALTWMCSYFEKERYLCGFIRFHPLLENDGYCRNVMCVIPDRRTIAVSLHNQEDEIWKSQITSKCRNMIRKAEKNGLEYFVEDDFISIEEFAVLYDKTMERLGADSFYRFGSLYYKKYSRDMTGKSFLGIVRLKGKIISAALFMYSEWYGHYHLAGSDRAYADYGANNFLLWNTIRELKKRRIKEFHLGGGTVSSADDSLFKFKKSFSRNEKDFYIGKCIFNRKAYEKICGEWEEKNADFVPVYGNRLLKYRYGRDVGHD